MSEQKHTPEPWRVNEDATGDIFISGADSTWIAEIGAPDEDGGRDDAARIVACVNACAGMADPAAELEQLRAENAELKVQGEPVAAFVRHEHGGYDIVDILQSNRVGPKAPGKHLLYTAPQPAAAADERTGHEKADKLIGRLLSSDPDFDDCSDAAEFIRQLATDQKGPDGFATWKDAAIAERLKRVAVEAKLNAQPAPDTASFKNFHRSLCERFGYIHDEIDWRRDLVSLEERIAAMVKQPAPTAPEDWKLVPVKPTEEMLQASKAALKTDAFGVQSAWASDLYVAMVDAAPEQPNPYAGTHKHEGISFVEAERSDATTTIIKDTGIS